MQLTPLRGRTRLARQLRALAAEPTVGRRAIYTSSNVRDKLLELLVGYVKASQANGLAAA
jgi:hypothetical protein